FGPTASAARLESSKAFAKTVMQAAGVPTARATVCDTVAAAQAAIAESGGRVVVKADGLAAGKGVTVCDSAAEAQEAAEGCLVGGLMLTAAGPRVIEFNVRFGDPEAQAILPRLDADLLDLLHRAATGSLEGATAPAAAEACVSVVVAAAGYPDAPAAGGTI